VVAPVTAPHVKVTEVAVEVPQVTVGVVFGFIDTVVVLVQPLLSV